MSSDQKSFGKSMKKRVTIFSTIVAATGLIFFIVWQVLHASLIPPAAQVAAEEGRSLPSYKVMAVDLISLRSVWLAWAFAAMVGYWQIEKQGRRSRGAAITLFAIYVVPLVTTSVMLLASGSR
jgi:hypothetical protein